MALCENGAVVGSVSGGCIEDDLIDRYTKSYALLKRVDKSTDANEHLNELPSGPPQSVKYGISADEAHRFGLPCGGTLELLLEFDPDADSLNQLIAQLESGLLVKRQVQLSTGEVSLSVCETPAELTLDEHHLVNTFGPEFRMLLIGAGQMAEYLATMAKFNGFAVSVCDPRQEYASSWSVPGVNLISDMPDDTVQRFRPDRRSCVIALSHDPKIDDLAILEALSSEAFYVGAIGSRRNNLSRKQRLKEHFDLSESSIAKLKGPIGLYIGSKTPAEIAVSIMAEVLAVKNNVSIAKEHEIVHAKNLKELE
jgi:xanthine dehydrogenase accessory factor